MRLLTCAVFVVLLSIPNGDAQSSEIRSFFDARATTLHDIAFEQDARVVERLMLAGFPQERAEETVRALGSDHCCKRHFKYMLKWRVVAESEFVNEHKRPVVKFMTLFGGKKNAIYRRGAVVAERTQRIRGHPPGVDDIRER